MVSQMATPTTIGARLKLLRGPKTIEEVSKATGLGRTALSNYEAGFRVPRDEAKLILANYYERTVDEIFFTADDTIRVNAAD